MGGFSQDYWKKQKQERLKLISKKKHTGDTQCFPCAAETFKNIELDNVGIILECLSLPISVLYI